jgi:hypothetical protein
MLAQIAVTMIVVAVATIALLGHVLLLTALLTSSEDRAQAPRENETAKPSKLHFRLTSW